MTDILIGQQYSLADSIAQHQAEIDAKDSLHHQYSFSGSFANSGYRDWVRVTEGTLAAG